MEARLFVLQRPVPKASGRAKGLTPSPLYENRRRSSPAWGTVSPPACFLPPSPGTKFAVVTVLVTLRIISPWWATVAYPI